MSKELQQMARYAPGSQTRAALAEKGQIAQRLLARGLTITQICQQLRCSPYFVRQIRDRTQDETSAA